MAFPHYRSLHKQRTCTITSHQPHQLLQVCQLMTDHYPSVSSHGKPALLTPCLFLMNPHDIWQKQTIQKEESVFQKWHCAKAMKRVTLEVKLSPSLSDCRPCHWLRFLCSPRSWGSRWEGQYPDLRRESKFGEQMKFPEEVKLHITAISGGESQCHKRKHGRHPNSGVWAERKHSLRVAKQDGTGQSALEKVSSLLLFLTSEAVSSQCL